MKKILALAAVAALGLASVASASPEPRCWYGPNSPSCKAFQGTNTTAKSERYSLDTDGDGVNDAIRRDQKQEFDHNRH